MTTPRGSRWLAATIAVALAAALAPTAAAHGGKYRPPPEEPPDTPPSDPPPPDPPTPDPPPSRPKDPEARKDPETPPDKTPTPPPTTDPDPGTPTPPSGGTPPGRDPTPDPRTKGPNRKKSGPGLEDWTAWWYHARDRFLDRTDREVASGGDGSGDAPAPGDAGWRNASLAALRAAFPDEDPEVFTGCAVAIGKSGGNADAPALLRALEHRYADATRRESVVLALGILGPEARGGRDALIAILRDRKDSVRLRGMAALALGLSRDPAAAPALLAAARDVGATKDPAGPAVLALGLLGEPIVVPDLVEIFSDTSDSAAKVLRPFAAFSLGRLGGPDAARALMKGLADSDQQVRRASILALGECEGADPAVLVPALARAVREDRDRPCRSFALVVLGRLGGPAAQDALSRCYALGDRGERNFAALGLGILGRSLEDAEARGRIAAALRSDFLNREDTDFRGALAISLGLLRDAKSLPAMRAIVKDRGDPELRAHCALALGLSGRNDGVAELRGALVEKGNPALQREAALALGLLADGGAAQVLANLLAASGPEHVRASAARALGELGGRASAEALRGLLADRTASGAARGQAAVGLGILLDGRKPGSLSALAAGLDFFATTPAITEALTIP